MNKKYIIDLEEEERRTLKRITHVRLQTIRDIVLSELGCRIGFLSQVDSFTSC